MLLMKFKFYEVDILGVHILGVDILGVDILGVDILRLTRVVSDSKQRSCAELTQSL